MDLWSAKMRIQNAAEMVHAIECAHGDLPVGGSQCLAQFPRFFAYRRTIWRALDSQHSGGEWVGSDIKAGTQRLRSVVGELWRIGLGSLRDLVILTLQLR
jgi:hypothetical protein